MAKVLLVEDDNNLREIYEARLIAEGYEVVGASDGEEALVVAKKEQPDLIIADVMMPRVSGFEMLDILRNTEGLKNVKVVMLTALGQAEDKTRADQLGADRYLVKSQVTLEDIVKAASDLLGGGGGQDQQQAPPPGQPSNQGGAPPQPTPEQNQPQPSNPAPTQQQPVAQAPQTPKPAPPQPDNQTAPTTPPPMMPQTNTPPQSQAPTTPTPPPSEPAKPQPEAETTPNQAPQPAPDNTSQLNEAVSSLICGTKTDDSQAQAKPQEPTTQPAPAPQPEAPTTPTPPPSEPAKPQPEAEEKQPEDSVTISGKKTIKPLSPEEVPKQANLNDLLAKENANNAPQPAPQNTGNNPSVTQPNTLPTTPHPAGHVFSPNNEQPQQPTTQGNPADPNSIAL